jgi:hypothetical protein
MASMLFVAPSRNISAPATAELTIGKSWASVRVIRGFLSIACGHDRSRMGLPASA